MQLPFTPDQFFQTFANYNTAVWPMQIVLYIVAAAIVALTLFRKSNGARWGALGLALMWIWTGVAYHLAHFTAINPGATLFGILFVLEAVLLLYFGVIRNRLSIASHQDGRGIVGWVFVLFALIVYPILSPILGHPYPAMPTFGLPCPLTIFTFSIFLWWSGREIVYIAIVPFLWSLIGLSAALNFEVYQDFSLVIAGILGFILMFGRRKGSAIG